MSDLVIRVEGLSKAYRLGAQRAKADTLVEAVYGAVLAPLRNLRRLASLDTFDADEAGDDLLWALSDVSFEIKRGEVVGFVGRNGAGKSTLLKILSRIAEPTRGRIEIHGRVSSLLEVGTGFHPELTGRENVYMNGTILGMKKAEIDSKFDEIVDFSGVETFLDTPVKRYSSGMKVRLAFAVAAHLEPEILIVDEVLAVGDAEFQKKCIGKMQDVAGGGRTVLYVSHNMGSVQSLCSRAITFTRGSLVDDGPPDLVVKRYLSELSGGGVTALSESNPERRGSQKLHFEKLDLIDKHGNDTKSLVAGEPFSIELQYQVTSEVQKAYIGLTFWSTSGVAITTAHTGFLGHAIPSDIGIHEIVCEFENNFLSTGGYYLSVWAYNDDEVFDGVPRVCDVDVSSSVFFSGPVAPKAANNLVYASHSWKNIS